MPGTGTERQETLNLNASDAKRLDEIFHRWLLHKIDIGTHFKNEDDEYQQMADFINTNYNINTIMHIASQTIGIGLVRYRTDDFSGPRVMRGNIENVEKLFNNSSKNSKKS